MRALIVGAGAVGGYFGGRLAQAGRDVTFLVRPNRAKQLATAGLSIVSPQHGDLTMRPKVLTTAEIDSPYDLIFVSVKSYSLFAAIEDFASAVGQQTMIVPVLNGMRHMDVLAARFGKERVLGGVCYLATELDSQGRIVQLAGFQSLSYGELDRKKTARIEGAHQLFNGAGFEAAISEDILHDMWQKWVWLATLGVITCLFRGNIGEVASTPGGTELSFAALDECAGIASACGYPLSEAFLAEKRTQLKAHDSTLTSSMYRDLQKQTHVEVDTILGDLMEHGQKYAVSAPILQAAFVSLSIYDRIRASQLRADVRR